MPLDQPGRSHARSPLAEMTKMTLEIFGIDPAKDELFKQSRRMNKIIDAETAGRNKNLRPLDLSVKTTAAASEAIKLQEGGGLPRAQIILSSLLATPIAVQPPHGNQQRATAEQVRSRIATLPTHSKRCQPGRIVGMHSVGFSSANQPPGRPVDARLDGASPGALPTHSEDGRSNRLTSARQMEANPGMPRSQSISAQWNCATGKFTWPFCAPAPVVFMGVRPWRKMTAPISIEQRRISEAVRAGEFTTEKCVTNDLINIRHRTGDIWIAPTKSAWCCDGCNQANRHAYNKWKDWTLHSVHQLGRQNILEELTTAMSCLKCGKAAIKL
ncbi:hypothetical protein QAD02_012873 [Eretmocerus hayati]|uniref:Uncharacterized protein n=1 Tax=Eretmocerus hayati TaxID=131215 RepID=A0ACC2P1Y9_9HYME|nr:hypothetical protein QAD02_012873 [Eretmocerus hayati]